MQLNTNSANNFIIPFNRNDFIHYKDKEGSVYKNAIHKGIVPFAWFSESEE